MPISSPEELLAATRDLLIAHGPMDEDELREQLLALGLTVDDEGDWFEEFLVETDPPIMPVADQRWVWLPALLEGRTFTHRLSEAEVEHDLLATPGDLAPLEVLIGDPPYDRFTDGADAAVVYPSDPELLDRAIDAEVASGAILLERGRLAGLGLGVGDIVGVRVEQDGLELLAVGEASGMSTGQALAALVGESPDRPHLIENSVWAVCAADNDLLRRPELPLGEQLESCGVARRGSLIATEGYDFDAGEAEEILRRIQEEHDLDESEAVAVVQLLQIVVGMTHDLDSAMETEEEARESEVSEALARWVGPAEGAGESAGPGLEGFGALGIAGEGVEAAVSLLRDPAVAVAFLDEALGVFDGEPVVVAALTSAWEPDAPRPARVALRWMRGVAVEEMGNVLGAEELYQQAEALDPSWPPALLSLAVCASDRGDAARGMSLLRRAGAEDDPLYGYLQQFLPGQGRSLPRNAPCWCGSGKKFKQCHLRQAQLPLTERWNWLYQKAVGYLIEKDTPFILELAEARAEHWDGTDGFDRALEEGLILDVALWEGGVFAEYLNRRGALLPPDELQLAQEWLLTRRSVYEVASAIPGSSITLRDVRTGEVEEVTELDWSRRVEAGEYYCTRVAPTVVGLSVFGGLDPVAASELEPVMALLDEEEPDTAELVEFLSRRFAPKTDPTAATL
ncbi:SEC-C domain-containing protein [Tessaracoccus sp. Y1736]